MAINFKINGGTKIFIWMNIYEQTRLVKPIRQYPSCSPDIIIHIIETKERLRVFGCSKKIEYDIDDERGWLSGRAVKNEYFNGVLSYFCMFS